MPTSVVDTSMDFTEPVEFFEDVPLTYTLDEHCVSLRPSDAEERARFLLKGTSFFLRRSLHLTTRRRTEWEEGDDSGVRLHRAVPLYLGNRAGSMAP
mmetsp:Transcript_24501/g.79181  ORF Transcript_24501/g.79181 Transcript_24501/m.79181 type:complete len:97 (+) Transcript_24501:68-358(+)